MSLPGPPAIMKKFIKLYLAASFDDVSISRKCERSFSWRDFFLRQKIILKIVICHNDENDRVCYNELYNEMKKIRG